jgi:short-subunit dehydrogenase
VYCTHRALPALKARAGLVVAVSSLAGKTGVPTRSAYAATKHAMQGFFDSLRVELRRTAVDVLVVSPGFVDTGIRDRNLGADGKPIGASPRDETTDTMSIDECVDLVVDGMRRRRREVVMTRLGKIGLWARLIVPDVVDLMAARAVTERGR